MRCLLVYDISDDRTRSKVADVCLDYGLDRIQFSAFMGRLNTTHRRELMKKMRRLLGRRPGKIQLFPLCANDWDNRDEIIQEDTRGESDVAGS